eukprot:9368340-Ditylum_brightwellii.AAC.1
MQHRQHEETITTTAKAETLAPALDQMKPRPPHSYDPVAATPDQMENIIANAIMNEECIPEESGIKAMLGKYKGLMWPQTFSKGHPAKDLLATYATTGCPVECGPDWKLDRILKAIKHGPHKSA